MGKAGVEATVVEVVSISVKTRVLLEIVTKRVVKNRDVVEGVTDDREVVEVATIRVVMDLGLDLETKRDVVNWGLTVGVARRVEELDLELDWESA